VTITSRQNPLVARFRTAARGDVGGVMLLDGTHLVSDAIAANVAFQLAAVTTQSSDQPEIRQLIDALVRLGVELVVVSGSVMDAVSPVKTPSGIVALAERPPADLDQLYVGAGALVVAAIDVQDPGNLGAIVRVAEAAGATGVAAAGGSANPFGWKALRGSMGSAFRLPVVPRVSIESALAATSKAGCRLVAAMLSGDAPDQMPLTGPIALFVGAEGQGLPDDVLSACDGRIAVPMTPPVESLNVAVPANRPGCSVKVLTFSLQRSSK